MILVGIHDHVIKPPRPSDKKPPARYRTLERLGRPN